MVYKLEEVITMKKKIFCDLCEKEIHTHTVIETHYHDYEPYEEERTYPNSNECHLIKCYICNECFNNFEEIIREKMIITENTYVKNLDVRLNKLKEEYEENIQKLKNECDEIKKLTCALKNADLATVDKSKYGLESKFPYSEGTYYLDSVEQVRKLKQRLERQG